MSHNHNHGCGHEGHDHDHDHGLPSDVLGHQDNLFSHIDRQNVVALNASGEGPEIIKAWNHRNDEETYLESDADDQMIIRVPFTGSVKLRALLLKAGPQAQTPAKIALFANENNLDFEDVADWKPTQELTIADTGREIGEYQVMSAKFTNISCVTLFVPASQGAETTRIYYVGFLGQWSERRSDPVVTVYEARANLADHEKIQGTEGNFSTPQP